ncbi:MAG: YebC/PmpR family DNA-binding transcriptional regulator [Candidatus Shapirobacteria bacterium]
MSGHSKWENIKRRKGAEDKKRGQVFSRYANLILAAIKEGGSSEPENNARLRAIIDEAKAANMPKSNIDRLLQKGNAQKELENFFLEGYGPCGLAVMIQMATDNRQRTTQEIKSIFRRYRGSLAEPGAVSFQFQRQVVIETPALDEEKILQAGDWGAADFKQEKGKVVFYLSAEKLTSFKEGLNKAKIKIISEDWIMRPKNLIKVDSQEEVGKFLNELEDNEDTIAVFTNCE